MSRTPNLVSFRKHPSHVAVVGGEIDLKITIPLAEFDQARECLGKIMSDDPSHVRRVWLDNDRTEEELDLLCATFWAAAERVPMSARNFLQWLDATGQHEALWDSACWQIGQREPAELVEMFSVERLEGLLALAKASAGQQLTQPRRRRQATS